MGCWQLRGASPASYQLEYAVQEFSLDSPGSMSAECVHLPAIDKPRAALEDKQEEEEEALYDDDGFEDDN